MVGSKRCYLCRVTFERGDDIVVCEGCGVRFHAACLEERGEDTCPRCVDEAWIGLVEF